MLRVGERTVKDDKYRDSGSYACALMESGRVAGITEAKGMFWV